MALTYDCTTELEAVNSMLEMIGESPVNELDDTQMHDALLAWKVLHNRSRSVQKQGLNCNTEQEYKFTPNLSNVIVLPANTLGVINIVGYDSVFIRDGKLYDTYAKSFTFTRSITGDLILFLEYETLPEHVREYILMLAARRFMSNSVGAADLLKQTDQDYLQAKRDFMRFEIKNQKNNIFKNPESDYILRRYV